MWAKPSYLWGTEVHIYLVTDQGSVLSIVPSTQLVINYHLLENKKESFQMISFPVKPFTTFLNSQDFTLIRACSKSLLFIRKKQPLVTSCYTVLAGLLLFIPRESPSVQKKSFSPAFTPLPFFPVWPNTQESCLHANVPCG